MNPKIEIALNHSPKHKNAIAAALVGIASSDIAAAAAIVKAKCKEFGITDFPTPFPHGSPEAMIWGGMDVATEAANDVAPADRNWSRLSKSKIALILNTEFGQDLDAQAVKALTKDQLVAKAEELAAATA